MIELGWAEQYRGAIRFALAVQTLIVLILLMLLDGGRMGRIGACVLAGCWIGTAIILYRRPMKPRPADLWFIRFGYLVPLILSVIVTLWLDL